MGVREVGLGAQSLDAWDLCPRASQDALGPISSCRSTSSLTGDSAWGHPYPIQLMFVQAFPQALAACHQEKSTFSIKWTGQEFL